jgi:hypothetical protein
MRVARVENGQRFRGRLKLWTKRLVTGREPSDAEKTMLYRPEFFGASYSDCLDHVMRGPSDWTKGERQLLAAFVSSLNQCVF